MSKMLPLLTYLPAAVPALPSCPVGVPGARRIPEHGSGQLHKSGRTACLANTHAHTHKHTHILPAAAYQVQGRDLGCCSGDNPKNERPNVEASISST